MQISALRDRLAERLGEFLWDEWAQLGVLSSARRVSPWAQDPEALILLTLEAARRDPRLFDEVLDWMLVNEAVLSSRRLRTLAVDAADRQLADAALAWVAVQRNRRLNKPAAPTSNESLFRGPAIAVRRPDVTFASFGLLRPDLAARRKSRQPDVRLPIAFAFRLRSLLGVGARAEAVRFLYTTDAPQATVAAVAASAAYAKRNVAEALTSLHTAGAVEMLVVGGDQRYRLDRDLWSPLVGTDPAPLQVDWPQIARALRLIIRWLEDADLDDASTYLRSSRIRDLLETLRPLFAHAGVVYPAWRGGDHAVDDLSDAIDALLHFSRTSPCSSSSSA